MTALAGVVSPYPQHRNEEFCRASLAAQALYGRGEASVGTVDSASFAIRPFQLVPEDSHDIGPVRTERGLIVADARLSNRSELLRELAPASGGQISDPGLVAAAWERWGVGALDRIVGDFAMAAYDRETRRLILARDPTGQRPLFYSFEEDAFRFASMPSGVFVRGRLAPDLARIAQLLAQRGSHDERSCFEGVRRLLPGQVAMWADGRLTTETFWNPRLDPSAGLTTEDLVERYRAMLDAAVEPQLRRRSGPVATHLSSGLDSSAVTATAARRRQPGEQILAFTSAPITGAASVGLYGRPADESAMAADSAAKLAVDHVVVRDSSPLLHVARGYARYFQEPVRNVLNMGWWTEINREAQQRGASVMLTAELGNITLNAGEMRVLAEWLRSGRWGSWMRQAYSTWRTSDASWRGILIGSFGPWLPETLMRGLDRLYDASPGWTISFVRPHLRNCEPANHHSGFSARRLSILTGTDFGPLRKGCLAQHGVDLRDPLSDRRLAEFALRLPPEQMFDRGVVAPLARQALADRVPGPVLSFRSRGFQGADWPLRLHRDDAATAIEELAASHSAQELLDIRRLRGFIDDWPLARATSSADLVWGRDFTAAIAAGLFLAEVERDPGAIGR